MSDNVPEKLQKYIDEILTLNHNSDEWQQIRREVELYMKELTQEQLDYFAESGAGEVLYMVTSK